VITAWLRAHHVPKAAMLARTALAAAEQQTVRLPAEQLTAQVSAELAGELLALCRRVKELDKLLRTRLAAHPQAAILTSLPGMGVLLAAEFAVAVKDLANFASPDHLAAYAGLAPAPHDSGRRVNNLHRPHRYNRDLLRVFYVSALIAAQRPGASRDYYQRKRREGKHHIQAVLALARRRVNVLWALLRDNRPFTLNPPATPARLDGSIGSHLLSWVRSPPVRAGGGGEAWVGSGRVRSGMGRGWARPIWRPEARVRWVWRGSSPRSPQRWAA
jgi:hypothetical protein